MGSRPRVMPSNAASEGYAPVHSSKHRRSRTLSSVSIPPAGSQPKIALVRSVSPLDPRSTAHHATVGAFTLTGCARTSLRCFSPVHVVLPEPDEQRNYRDPATRLPMPGDSPPISPASSFASIPFISRTTSPFSETEAKHTVPSGDMKGKGQHQPMQIHAVLRSLERDSRWGQGARVRSMYEAGDKFPALQTLCADVVLAGM
ncbi:hypothetical protein B0H19DRAFT_1272506 [Mycena capillaripes]|nr:hypothetical protein B0H19DRAFT_1272506 [Mycena capillaripes]